VIDFLKRKKTILREKFINKKVKITINEVFGYEKSGNINILNNNA